MRRLRVRRRVVMPENHLRVRWLALGLGAVVCAVLASSTATWSAFSGATTNQGNTFSSGTVTLSDNDGNASMFAVSGLRPGDTHERCLVVTYTGSLPSSVRLSGATTGTGLGAFLDVTVTRGTIASPSFSGCAGFSPDSGGGVLYTGTLAGMPSSYATGLVDPTAAWSTGEAYAYRVQVTQQDDYAAQGLTATTTLNWEARNT